MSFLAPFASLAGPLLGAAGGLFGSSSGASAPQINYTPTGFSGGGLTGSMSGGNFNVSPTSARSNLVGGLSSTFGNQATALGQLRSTVTPGFSQFRQAGMNTLESGRQAAIGNLRQNLARRRVLGSSFAQSALGNVDAQYAQNEANFQADAYLKELAANNQLLQQQFEAARGQFTTGLNEMNLEANLASLMKLRSISDFIFIRKSSFSSSEGS